MRKFKIFLAVIFAVLCISACGTEKISGISVSPDNKNFTQLLTREYSEEELQNMLGFEGNINELDSLYPIECLRKYTGLEDKACYWALYRGENKLAILSFGDDGIKFSEAIFELTKTKSDFEEIKINDSIDMVEKFDPDGDFFHVYASSGINPTSYHFTTDGYMVIIRYCYDDGLFVDKIEYMNI